MAEVLYDSEDIVDDDEEYELIDVEELNRALDRLTQGVMANRDSITRLEALMEARWTQQLRDDERLHKGTLGDLRHDMRDLNIRLQALENMVAKMVGKMMVIGSLIGAGAGGAASIITVLFGGAG